jgi:nitrogen fixation protein FixH
MKMKQTKIYQSPTIIIGFTLFLALVIGTIYRINTAFVTHPGLVTADPYNSGQDYGKSQKVAKKLAKQGFKLSLKKHSFVEANKDFIYSANLTQNQQPIKNAKVKFYFYRPLEEDYDFEAPAVFNGKNWELVANLPRKGKWRVVVEADFDGKQLHIFDKIFVNNVL